MRQVLNEPRLPRMPTTSILGADCGQVYRPTLSTTTHQRFSHFAFSCCRVGGCYYCTSSSSTLKRTFADVPIDNSVSVDFRHFDHLSSACCARTFSLGRRLEAVLDSTQQPCLSFSFFPGRTFGSYAPTVIDSPAISTRQFADFYRHESFLQ